MPIVDSQSSRDFAPELSTTGRDPKVRASGKTASIGESAFKDSLILVGVSWALLIFISYSVRSHNI